MPTSLPGPVVSTDWLAANLSAPDVVVADASWYLPAANRDPHAEYLAEHLPGAVFFDLDRHAAADTALPHMLPDPARAARLLGELGIGDGDLVVGYDGSGVNLSAPRLWWHLRVLGHDRVAVLDGGIARWRAEGRRLESGAGTRPPATFTPRPRPALVRSFDAVRSTLGGAVQVVDARAAGRFEGREPEPRPGLRGGHIPGARNVPFGRMVDADGRLLPAAELAARFRDAGVDLARPIVLSCGSGVSACALALGLEVLGHRDYAVYDGSWAEWGGRDDAPVAVGPA